MLAQVALIAFALFALLALIVDLGLARVTQGQMQMAADAAALEGLRHRDVGVVNPATGQSVNNAFASDCIRRAAAHRLVREVFDDDHDPTFEDPDYRFGAGPVIDLTDGETSLHGLQAMSVPEPPVYEPSLQLNQQNAVDGDMISGRFCYSADPGPSEGVAFSDASLVVCTQPQRGVGAYARNDFNPSPNAPPPPAALPDCPLPDDPPPNPWPPSPGTLANANNNAFLVRLRRSNELGAFDGQTDPGVASSGPALPLLFGRGAPIHGDNVDGGYSVRRDGLTVRATAISEVRPALHVGLPQTTPVQQGVTPFSLRDTYVATLGAVPQAVTLNPANGLICIGATCVGVNPPTGVGRFIANPANPNRAAWMAISTVGQALPASAPAPCATALPFSGFGPVYSLMTSGTNRVVGFTRIVLARDPARPANPCAGVVSRGASTVTASNATALLSTGLPLPAATPPAEIDELLDKHFGRTGVDYGPLLVPVLVR
ncbi:MAG: pilus assembly protein TadG-related protein [Acidobacteriota bacterium]